MIRALRCAVVVGLAAICAPTCTPRRQQTEPEAAAVVLAGDGLEVTVSQDPFRVAAHAGGRELLRGHRGLYLVRNGRRAGVRRATLTARGEDFAKLECRLEDGSSLSVEIRREGANAVRLELQPGDPSGVSHWGWSLRLRPDERIYGLTERIAGRFKDAELFPKAVGSLDRRGEFVRVYPTLTIGGAVPLHHSSRGIGVYVETSMPGEYDVGAARNEELDLRFEFSQSAQKARLHLLYGPDHFRIQREYTRLAGRPFRPSRAFFRHWRGLDHLPSGELVPVDGVELNPSIAAEISAMDRFALPPGIYLFDRPWAVGVEGYGRLQFDPARFPNPIAMLRALRDRGWRVIVWASPWAIGERGAAARARGSLAPPGDGRIDLTTRSGVWRLGLRLLLRPWRGSAVFDDAFFAGDLASGPVRDLDLTNPGAVGWLKDDLRRFLAAPDGRLVDGFFLDRADEFHPSRERDVYHDGRTGREIHNAYAVLAARVFRDVLDEERGERGLLMARSFFAGSQRYAAKFAGDVHNRDGIEVPERANDGAPTDLGLRGEFVSLGRSAFMGMPYRATIIGGIGEIADRENFARWIEFGAVNPVMLFFGKGSHAPWDLANGELTDPGLLEILRRYLRLREALLDYLHAAGERAAAEGTPIARPLVFDFPDDPAVADLWDEWLLGPDLLAAPVWRSGAREREVYLPAGRWVDYWRRDRVIDGPARFAESAPLDHLPLFAREGSVLLTAPPPVAPASP